MSGQYLSREEEQWKLEAWVDIGKSSLMYSEKAGMIDNQVLRNTVKHLSRWKVFIQICWYTSLTVTMQFSSLILQTLLTHGNYLGMEEIEMISKTAATVVHCPTTDTQYVDITST